MFAETSLVPSRGILVTSGGKASKRGGGGEKMKVTCKSQRLVLTRRCPSSPGGRTRESSTSSLSLSELGLPVPTSLLGRGDGG